jgi:hypothetical protein
MPKGKPFGDSFESTKWEAIDLTQQPATRRLLTDDEPTLQGVDSRSAGGGERGDNRYHRTFYEIIKRALDDERKSLGVPEANLAATGRRRQDLLPGSRRRSGDAAHVPVAVERAAVARCEEEWVNRRRHRRSEGRAASCMHGAEDGVD